MISDQQIVSKVLLFCNLSFCLIYAIIACKPVLSCFPALKEFSAVDVIEIWGSESAMRLSQSCDNWCIKEGLLYVLEEFACVLHALKTDSRSSKTR